MSTMLRGLAVVALLAVVTAPAVAQQSGLPNLQIVQDKPGWVHFRVVNTLERPITAILVFSTVTKVSDGQVLSTAYEMYDSTLNPRAAFSLKPGETYDTPGQIADWSVAPGPNLPSGVFKHTFELVAVATDAPDLRGDPKHAILIQQRRKARHDGIAACAALLQRNQGADVAVADLLSQIETMRQGLVAGASNSEEQVWFDRLPRGLAELVQGGQRPHGQELLSARILARLLQKYEQDRVQAASALIP